MLLQVLRPLPALSHPTRWRIAERVSDQLLSAGDLAEILQLPRSTVSDHLQIMLKAGLLTKVRRARVVCYNLVARHGDLISCLRRELKITEATDPILAADAWNANRFTA